MFEVPTIVSNQDGPHPKLLASVQRHLERPFAPPAGARRAALYAAVAPLIASAQAEGRAVILDSGCGRGESSFWLARQNPQALVLGVDKSEQRLSVAEKQAMPPQLHFLRAELSDLWLLAWQHGWRFEQLAMLYPNPWPKSEHLKRRWHGHPIFPFLLHSCDQLVLRTNWAIYAAEFATACRSASGLACQAEAYHSDTPITAFERKYQRAGQALYEVRWHNPGWRFAPKTLPS